MQLIPAAFAVTDRSEQRLLQIINNNAELGLSKQQLSWIFFARRLRDTDSACFCAHHTVLSEMRHLSVLCCALIQMRDTI